DFRVALDKAFSKVEALSDEDRKTQTDVIVRDLLEAPLGRLDKQLNALARHAGIQAAVLLGSLAATILSGAVPAITALLGTAAVAAGLYRKEKGEEQNLKEHPSQFYWDATRNARKRSTSHVHRRSRHRRK